MAGYFGRNDQVFISEMWNYQQSEDDLVYTAGDDCNGELDDSFARELFQSDSESEFEGFDI